MKKILVDKDVCISCGYCTGAAPENFKFEEIDGSLVSQPVKEEVEEVSEDVKVAIEGCPTGAIKVEDEEE